jgi:transcriptional regulator with XRE-family HTH domain
MMAWIITRSRDDLREHEIRRRLSINLKSLRDARKLSVAELARLSGLSEQRETLRAIAVSFGNGELMSLER